MKVCSVDGCDRAARSAGMCNRHYEHKRRYGSPVAAREYSARGEPSVRTDGYVRVRLAGERVLEHVVIAERALGRPLPPGVEVHHVDTDRANNSPSNLVVCTAAYHKLLHQRMRARDACGNPNWRLCMHCKEYDEPSRLIERGPGRMAHRDCYNEYQRLRHAARKEQA